MGTPSWKKLTLSDVLMSSDSVSSVITAVETTTSAAGPVVSVLSAVADAINAAESLISSITAADPMAAAAALVKQVQDEVFGTGVKVLPMFDHALEDYIQLVRTGKRFYQTTGGDAYTQFMTKIIQSFDDNPDTDRPITTGPIAGVVFMVAAPTFTEITAQVTACVNAFSSLIPDLLLVKERMESITGVTQNTVKFTTPPDWEDGTLGDILNKIPGVGDNLSDVLDSIVKTLQANAYAGDIITQGIGTMLLKVEVINNALLAISQYVSSLTSILDIGGFVLGYATDKGVDDFQSKLTLANRPAVVNVDNYVAGFVLLAEGANVTGFKGMWAQAFTETTI